MLKWAHLSKASAGKKLLIILPKLRVPGVGKSKSPTFINPKTIGSSSATVLKLREYVIARLIETKIATYLPGGRAIAANTGAEVTVLPSRLTHLSTKSRRVLSTVG